MGEDPRLPFHCPPTLLLAALLPVLAVPAPRSAPRATTRASADSANRVPFEEAAQRAKAARESGAADEALRWYRQAVAARPSWDEGWWYIGAVSYERGHWTEAAEAYRRFVLQKPDAGPGWAMRGLSEFAAGRDDAALASLTKAMQLPSVGNAEIRDAVYLDLAQLHIKQGDFERAVEPLSALARVQPESPTLVAACGLVLLREATRPSAVPAARQELVTAAGRASYAALGHKPDAAARFEDVLQRFPRTPGLHYGYGAWLRSQGAASQAAALEQFRREIEVDPKAVYPRLEIAFELMKNGEHAAAVPYAEEAVKLAPGLFAAHHALGRALLEAGDVERATRELEAAVRLAPDVPETRAALARVYVMSGRRADALDQREAFERLQAQRAADRAQRSAGAPVNQEPKR